MSFKFKPLGAWKTVEIEKSPSDDYLSSGLISLEELTDYEVIKSEKPTSQKKTQRRKKDLKGKQNLVTQEDHLDKKTDKKKKKRKKNVKTKSESVQISLNDGEKMEAEEESEERTKKTLKRKRTLQGPLQPPRKRKKTLDQDSEVQKGTKVEKRKTVVSEFDLKELEKELPGWRGLFVPAPVLQALKDKNFTEPTPIQVRTLPSAIRDRLDIVGAAETGSGKTLAFAIPILNRILQLKEAEKKEEGNSDVEEMEQESGDDEDEGTEKLVEEAEVEADEEMETADVDAASAEENYEEEHELEDGGVGCVRTVHNVKFDWLDKTEVVPDKPVESRPLYALILTPTRELAIQVRDHIRAVTKYTSIQCVAVVGGMAVQKQERLLRRQPEIVIATPGRLWELYNEQEPHLSKLGEVRCLVVDEADRMVEQGHFQELDNLLQLINRDEKKRKMRQNFVFSATLTFVHQAPQRLALKKKKKRVKMTTDIKIASLIEKIGMNQKPKVLDLTAKQGTASSLTESRISCSVVDKDLHLYSLLLQYPHRTLVFCNSKDCVRRLVSVMSLLKCNPLPLHADMQQRQRLKNLDRFRDNARGLLIATDVAARGLDIPGVEQVIHFQVPRTTENYVHRSGRTARASKEGLSVMMVSPDDLRDYRKIIKALNRDEDLPVFPTESEFVLSLKPRVSLARSIDTQEHKLTKIKQHNSWFEKAAQDIDRDLDMDELLQDVGDSRQQATERDKLQNMRNQLTALLREPVQRRTYSGKYPTLSGQLVMPYTPDQSEGGAVRKLKQSIHETAKITATAKMGRRRKRKFKKKQKQ